jgi:hypothetical protein
MTDAELARQRQRVPTSSAILRAELKEMGVRAG